MHPIEEVKKNDQKTSDSIYIVEILIVTTNIIPHTPSGCNGIPLDKRRR